MKIMLLLLACGAMSSLLSLSALGQSYAITNAKVVTVSGETIEKGTVIIRDGLIEAVGTTAKVPSDAQVFDGTGLTVYPGFIDTLTGLGMAAPPARPTAGGPSGGGAAAAASATPTSNSNYPAGLRPEVIAAEELRAGESQFETNRNAGFTTVLTVGRTGIFNGQSAIIDLAGDSVSEMIVKSPFAEHVSFSTIPGQYPGSLLGTFSALRQMLYDAQRLQELRRMYEANPKGMKRPEADRSLDALIPVLNRQVPVVFTANRVNEIVRALDLAREFNLKAYIAGGQEAWKVTDRLKAQDVPVLLSLNYPKRTAAASAEADPESLDLLRFRAETPKGAAKLAQAGVKFAFQSGGVTNIADYFTNAKNTVDGGLSREAAIRAMTLSGAELLGVADRTGSIDSGKIANLTVVKGDLFGSDRAIKTVFVDGKPFEQKEQPAASAGGRRGGRPDATPPTAAPAIMEVGGNFTITIEVPGQSMQGTLVLVQQTAAITGSLTTQLGTAVVRNGRVSADGFTFASTVEVGGTSMEINVTGKVTGNRISGTIDSPQGAIPFTGTRNP